MRDQDLEFKIKELNYQPYYKNLQRFILIIHTPFLRSLQQHDQSPSAKAGTDIRSKNLS